MGMNTTNMPYCSFQILATNEVQRGQFHDYSERKRQSHLRFSWISSPTRFKKMQIGWGCRRKMSNKSVLLNCLERNTVFTILASTDLPDISFLEREFRKELKFHGNVDVGITFQRFDKAWEENVDVDVNWTTERSSKQLFFHYFLTLVNRLHHQMLNRMWGDACDLRTLVKVLIIIMIFLIGREQVKCLQLVVLYLKMMMKPWHGDW